MDTRSRCAVGLATLLLCSGVMLAKNPKKAVKDPPKIVMTWPPAGEAVIRLEFGTFQQIGSVGKQSTYVTDVDAENLWGKKISNLGFDVFLYDKDKTRIGQTYLVFSNVEPAQKVKLALTFAAIGAPVSLEIAPVSLPKELGPAPPPRTVPIQIQSVPSGAELKVDSQPAGVTPKTVRLSPGQHTLEFSKEGFRTGTYPLEVGPDDAGGSVNLELAGLSHDTLELRDGTVLVGDVDEVTPSSVEVRIAGKPQTIDRNQVKKIILVEREPLKH